MPSLNASEPEKASSRWNNQQLSTTARRSSAGGNILLPAGSASRCMKYLNKCTGISLQNYDLSKIYYVSTAVIRNLQA